MPLIASEINNVSCEINYLASGSKLLRVQFAPILVSSSGHTTIVAGLSDKKIRVLQYLLVSSGTVEVNWASDVQPITGTMSMSNGSVISTPFSFVGLFETNTGDNLQIYLSSNVTVGGHMVYTYI